MHRDEAPAVFARTERLEIHPLGEGDEARLQAVFQAAGDYFLPVTGRAEPAPDAAEREIRGCIEAPGRDVAVIVWRESGEDVGAIGWWKGVPEPHTALLGMLMVGLRHRRRGFAGEALAGLEATLRGQGVTHLRSAAGAADRRAQEVLAAMGFDPVDEQHHVNVDRGRVRIRMYDKPIGAP